jgi:hypothetical protein
MAIIGRCEDCGRSIFDWDEHICSCPICKGSRYKDVKHRCPNGFLIWVMDDYHEGEEPEKVFVHGDEEDAALHFAEVFDSESDYSIIGGEQIEFKVVSILTPEKIHIFQVTARMEPIYSAKRDIAYYPKGAKEN